MSEFRRTVILVSAVAAAAVLVVILLLVLIYLMKPSFARASVTVTTPRAERKIALVAVGKGSFTLAQLLLWAQIDPLPGLRFDEAERVVFRPSKAANTVATAQEAGRIAFGGQASFKQQERRPLQVGGADTGVSLTFDR